MPCAGRDGHPHRPLWLHRLHCWQALLTFHTLAHTLARVTPLLLVRQVGAQLADVMVAVGMQPSKGAVRRLIKVGAVLGGSLWG